MRSRPFSSVMKAGGAYLLGGAKTFPQASGPLFSRPAAGVPAGRRRLRWLRPGGAGGGGEERVREHGQGDVPVPGTVLADLVVVQAGLVLCFGEAVLDRPPRPGHRDDLGQRDRAGRPAAEVRQLELAFLARGQGPADQQVTGAGRGADLRPVVNPWPLGSVGPPQPLPPPPRTPHSHPPPAPPPP